MTPSDWDLIDWDRTAGLAVLDALLSLLGAAGMTGRWGGAVVTYEPENRGPPSFRS